MNAASHKSFQAHASNFPRVWIGDVCSAIAESAEIDPKAMMSARRDKPLAHARQDAMLLIRRLTRNSLPAIGRRFSGRDHTTVLHACRASSKRIADDAAAEIRIARLERQLLDNAARREAAELLNKGLSPITAKKPSRRT